MKGKIAPCGLALLAGLLTCLAGCDSTAPDGTPPSVTITSPQPNDIITSKAVRVAVTATDNEAVARVELRVNGSLHDEALVSPWELAWQTDALPAGHYLLRATAVDRAGNEASHEVSVDLRDVVLVTEMQVTGTYDPESAPNLEIEVHLFDADDGGRIGCAGASTGLGPVDSSDQLYTLEASFISLASGATLLYDEVASHTLAVAVFEMDVGACPQGVSLLLGDDLVGISPIIPGEDLAGTKILSFDNVVRLVMKAGRTS